MFRPRRTRGPPGAVFQAFAGYTAPGRKDLTSVNSRSDLARPRCSGGTIWVAASHGDLRPSAWLRVTAIEARLPCQRGHFREGERLPYVRIEHLTQLVLV